MTKRKHKKKHHKRKTHKSKNKNFKILNLLLIIIAALILTIIYILYTYGTDNKQELKKDKIISSKNIQKTIENKIIEVEKKTEEKIDKYVNDLEIKKDEFEEYTKDLYEEYVDKDIIDTINNKVNDTKEIQQKMSVKKLNQKLKKKQNQ